MKFHNSVLVLMLCLFACGCKPASSKTDRVIAENLNRSTESPQKEPYPVNDNVNPIVVDTTKRLMSFVAEHPFSDPRKNDIFSIALYGRSITDGVVLFEIFNNKHERIFTEKLPKIYLVMKITVLQKLRCRIPSS
jgi:hypothetical protein